MDETIHSINQGNLNLRDNGLNQKYDYGFIERKQVNILDGRLTADNFLKNRNSEINKKVPSLKGRFFCASPVN